MSIRIKLVEDQTLVVNADSHAWAHAYKAALDDNEMIKVHASDGRTLAINPRQILYWEETPDSPHQDLASAPPQTQPA